MCDYFPQAAQQIYRRMRVRACVCVWERESMGKRSRKCFWIYLCDLWHQVKTNHFLGQCSRIRVTRPAKGQKRRSQSKYSWPFDYAMVVNRSFIWQNLFFSRSQYTVRIVAFFQPLVSWLLRPISIWHTGRSWDKTGPMPTKKSWSLRQDFRSGIVFSVFLLAD